MKKILSVLRSYLGHAGAYFLFTMVAFGLLSQALGESALNPVLIWTSLLFAAVVAVADYVFLLGFLGSYLLKLLIHGILTVAAFAVSFVGVSHVVERGRTGVFGVLFFALLYVVIAVVRVTYHFLSEKRENAKQNYKNLYTPKNLD